MKDRRRRTPPADPTSERTADQSTQENSGLHAGPEDSPFPLASDEGDEGDVLNRDAGGRFDTSRRPTSGNADRTSPADHSRPKKT